MNKRFKSVSMLLFLGSISTGIVNATPTNDEMAVSITQQAATCQGIVKDATGEAVIGASVVVKGTTNGTITDLDGNFALSNVNKGDALSKFHLSVMLPNRWFGTANLSALY